MGPKRTCAALEEVPDPRSPSSRSSSSAVIRDVAVDEKLAHRADADVSRAPALEAMRRALETAVSTLAETRVVVIAGDAWTPTASRRRA